MFSSSSSLASLHPSSTYGYFVCSIPRSSKIQKNNGNQRNTLTRTTACHIVALFLVLLSPLSQLTGAVEISHNPPNPSTLSSSFPFSRPFSPSSFLSFPTLHHLSAGNSESLAVFLQVDVRKLSVDEMVHHRSRHESCCGSVAPVLHQLPSPPTIGTKTGSSGTVGTQTPRHHIHLSKTAPHSASPSPPLNHRRCGRRLSSNYPSNRYLFWFFVCWSSSSCGCWQRRLPPSPWENLQQLMTAAVGTCVVGLFLFFLFIDVLCMFMQQVGCVPLSLIIQL
eukprot:GHVS01026731.1.p1 GENE.GHVS01026731.1~~GHVS01026731.1.p1  ORF type:complete len:279 (+),score=44.61 GHVS01026731.1:279-1115(+)